MCKSVEIFCKKDGDAQHDEARTGREGHGRPQGGGCPDVGRKNFSTAWQSAGLGARTASKKI